MQNTLLGRNLPICSKLIPDFNLEDKVDFEGGGNVTSGNSTRTIKEIGREKNNEEVSSDAMIVDNRKTVRMQKANSLMMDYVCEEYY